MLTFLTGGSRGIGKQIKETLISNNIEVFSPDRKVLNLSDTSSVSKFLDKYEDIPDVLINCAGIHEVCDVDSFDIHKFYNIMNTNFASHAILSSHFINKSHKNNKKLNIVNIGSIRINNLKQGRLFYSISKASLELLTKYITLECSNKNVICNMISPGYIKADMLHKNNSSEDILNMIKKIPSNKLGNTKDISELILFLINKNEYINGQNIVIDGGLTCY